jgi:signal transduction histidine kinase
MGSPLDAFAGLFRAEGIFAALLDPAGRVLQQSEACARLAASGSPDPGDLFAPPPDGTAAPVEWERHRVPEGWLVLGRKIGEPRRREDEARQALRLESLGRLAAGITHDFNNLLTVIGGHADLLAGSAAPDPDSLLEIRRAVGSATILTRRLLAFARLQPLDPEPVDLEGLLGQMETLLPRVLGAAVRIDVSGPGRPVWVRADPGQLDQVLLNLALNAKDAMPRGGTLSLRLSEEPPPGRDGDWARLLVRDDGHGMDAGTRARIFEPFFTTKGPAGGSGLGLASVHGIVLQHGGLIRVDSEPGRGATFEIHLPRLPEGAPAAPAGADDPVPTGQETILLVEDSAAVRRLMANALRSHGYRVLEASEGEEALKMAWRHPEPIGLLLTDVQMPRVDGRELAGLMAASRPGLKILLATGQPDPDPASSQALPSGVPVLPKPFTPTELLRKVREVLDQVR